MHRIGTRLTDLYTRKPEKISQTRLSRILFSLLPSPGFYRNRHRMKEPVGQNSVEAGKQRMKHAWCGPTTPASKSMSGESFFHFPLSIASLDRLQTPPARIAGGLPHPRSVSCSLLISDSLDRSWLYQWVAVELIRRSASPNSSHAARYSHFGGLLIITDCLTSSCHAACCTIITAARYLTSNSACKAHNVTKRRGGAEPST